jgi:hypothetical protein
VAFRDELLFPLLVDGGGYTTQFILFSGAAGQISLPRFHCRVGLHIVLRVVKQNGSPFPLSVTSNSEALMKLLETPETDDGARKPSTLGESQIGQRTKREESDIERSSD